MNGDKSSDNPITRQSETLAVLSCDEIQVKEEVFESLFSTSPVHFDNIGDDEFGDHSLQTSQTTSSLQQSTISRPPSYLDNKDAAEVQKLLAMNVELERHLKEEKTAREELVAENDRLHKAQIQLQEQNSKLQAALQGLQEQYEEKCRQLRECEKQHSQHSQQERVKQERVDDNNAAELKQPLQLPAGQRRGNAAIAKEHVDVEVVSDEHVKQEALADDRKAGEVEEEEGVDSESYHSEEEYEGEDVSDSGSEDPHDSDDRLLKR